MKDQQINDKAAKRQRKIKCRLLTRVDAITFHDQHVPIDLSILFEAHI